jgi:hypothetical protein
VPIWRRLASAASAMVIATGSQPWRWAATRSALVAGDPSTATMATPSTEPI